jgi:hypothetical protein
MTMCVVGIRQIFHTRLPIVIYTDYPFLSPAKFERCVALDSNINGASVSPTQCVALTSISTVLSSSISSYLCLPPPVSSVHFSIAGFRCHIAVNVMPRGVKEMLRVGSLPHQPSHAFDNVSTPVFDRPLFIIIPSHILESV